MMYKTKSCLHLVCGDCYQAGICQGIFVAVDTAPELCDCIDSCQNSTACQYINYENQICTHSLCSTWLQGSTTASLPPSKFDRHTSTTDRVADKEQSWRSAHATPLQWLSAPLYHKPH